VQLRPDATLRCCCCKNSSASSRSRGRKARCRRSSSAFRERGLAVDRWEATPEEISPYRDHVGEQKTYSDRPNVVGVRDGRSGGQFAPSEVPPDAPICEAVKRAHELATGGEPAIQGVPYGADMRLFIRFGGMPCVMYGAGDVNVAHAPDEHISITELMTATKTVACLLVDWCGVQR
jgi:acetylornithine deacetylase/succinyl-diaminopimelate desuccinylase-like protein